MIIFAVPKTQSKFRVRGKRNSYEKDFSTLCSQAQKQARFPKAYGFSQWPKRIELSSSKRTKKVDRQF